MSPGSRLRPWWPTLAWAAVIVVLTTLPVPRAAFRSELRDLDKVIHFVLYLGLGWTMGRGLWLTHRATVPHVLAALLVGLAFAAADEWHQTLLPMREAAFSDWLADAAGVALGLALNLWPKVRRAGAAAGAREPGGRRTKNAGGAP